MKLLSSKPETLPDQQTELASHENFTFLNGVEPSLLDFATKHCIDLLLEMGAETPSERQLCEAATGAMARHLTASRMLKILSDEYWSATNTRTRRPTRNYLGEYEETWHLVSDYAKRVSAFSKEADRGLRQYQSIIAQLVQMKSPVPEVHIKTAFVGQNQQFNAPRTL